MYIQLLSENNLTEAIDLVWTVFEEFEVPIYPPKGVQSFKDFISYDNILKMYQEHMLIFWGCFYEEHLIGVIALRGLSHISLLFVQKEWHRNYIATYLFQALLGYVKLTSHSDFITVNASPYGEGFYKAIGFKEMSAEKEIDGIRFIPMEYIIPQY